MSRSKLLELAILIMLAHALAAWTGWAMRGAYERIRHEESGEHP